MFVCVMWEIVCPAVFWVSLLMDKFMSRSYIRSPWCRVKTKNNNPQDFHFTGLEQLNFKLVQRCFLQLLWWWTVFYRVKLCLLVQLRLMSCMYWTLFWVTYCIHIYFHPTLSSCYLPLFLRPFTFQPRLTRWAWRSKFLDFWNCPLKTAKL